MWFKLIFLIPMILILGCNDNSNSPNTNQQQYTLGVSVSHSQRNPFFTEGYNTYNNYSSNHPNIKILLNDAQDNQTTQINALQQMISEGAQALIVNLVDTGQANSVIDLAKNANIPIVFWNRKPQNQFLFSYKNSVFIGGDDTQAGVLQGLAVLDAWKQHPEWDRNRDGVIQYAILQGLPGVANTIARTKWSISTLESYPSIAHPIEEVFNDNAMYSPSVAKEVTNRWLQSPNSRNIEIILANNDSMAIGAIEAQRAHSFYIPTFGIDAIPDAKQLLTDGELAGTVLNDVVTQVEMSIQAAINLINGEPANAHTDYRISYQQIDIPYKAVENPNLHKVKSVVPAL